MICFFENYDSFSAEDFMKFLPQNRIEKCMRLAQKRDRENCVAAYVILSRMLSQNGVENFEICEDENGKPFIKNSSLHFNISHCRCGVAVALSKSPVGIDIQELRPYNDRVAKRVCTPAEIDFINSSDDVDRTFIRLWTLKEAAAKCDGKGLKIIRDFSFETDEKNFKKYGKNFKVFDQKNLIISVCGNEDFSDIIKTKNLEDF